MNQVKATGGLAAAVGQIVPAGTGEVRRGTGSGGPEFRVSLEEVVADGAASPPRERVGAVASPGGGAKLPTRTLPVREPGGVAEHRKVFTRGEINGTQPAPVADLPEEDGEDVDATEMQTASTTGNAGAPVEEKSFEGAGLVRASAGVELAGRSSNGLPARTVHAALPGKSLAIGAESAPAAAELKTSPTQEHAAVRKQRSADVQAVGFAVPSEEPDVLVAVSTATVVDVAGPPALASSRAVMVAPAADAGVHGMEVSTQHAGAEVRVSATVTAATPLSHVAGTRPGVAAPSEGKMPRVAARAQATSAPEQGMVAETVSPMAIPVAVAAVVQAPVPAANTVMVAAPVPLRTDLASVSLAAGPKGAVASGGSLSIAKSASAVGARVAVRSQAAEASVVPLTAPSAVAASAGVSRDAETAASMSPVKGTPMVVARSSVASEAGVVSAVIAPADSDRAVPLAGGAQSVAQGSAELPVGNAALLVEPTALAGNAPIANVTGVVSVGGAAAPAPAKAQAGKHEVVKAEANGVVRKAVAAKADATASVQPPSHRPAAQAEDRPAAAPHTTAPLVPTVVASSMGSVTPQAASAPVKIAEPTGTVAEPLHGTVGLASPEQALQPGDTRTLAATPQALEVGVASGTHGWLRVRAEMGAGGEVSASVLAPSSAAAQALKHELPALTEYLSREQVGVTSVAVASSFASGTAAMSSSVDAGGQRQGREQPAYSPAARQDLRGESEPWDGVSSGSLFGLAEAAQPAGRGGGWVNVRV